MSQACTQDWEDTQSLAEDTQPQFRFITAVTPQHAGFGAPVQLPVPSKGHLGSIGQPLAAQQQQSGPLCNEIAQQPRRQETCVIVTKQQQHEQLQQQGQEAEEEEDEVESDGVDDDDGVPTFNFLKALPRQQPKPASCHPANVTPSSHAVHAVLPSRTASTPQVQQQQQLMNSRHLRAPAGQTTVAPLGCYHTPVLATNSAHLPASVHTPGLLLPDKQAHGQETPAAATAIGAIAAARQYAVPGTGTPLTNCRGVRAPVVTCAPSIAQGTDKPVGNAVVWQLEASGCGDAGEEQHEEEEDGEGEGEDEPDSQMPMFRFLPSQIMRGPAQAAGRSNNSNPSGLCRPGQAYGSMRSALHARFKPPNVGQVGGACRPEEGVRQVHQGCGQPSAADQPSTSAACEAAGALPAAAQKLQGHATLAVDGDHQHRYSQPAPLLVVSGPKLCSHEAPIQRVASEPDTAVVPPAHALNDKEEEACDVDFSFLHDHKPARQQQRTQQQQISGEAGDRGHKVMSTLRVNGIMSAGRDQPLARATPADRNTGRQQHQHRHQQRTQEMQQPPQQQQQFFGQTCNDHVHPSAVDEEDEIVDDSDTEGKPQQLGQTHGVPLVPGRTQTGHLSSHHTPATQHISTACGRTGNVACVEQPSWSREQPPVTSLALGQHLQSEVKSSHTGQALFRLLLTPSLAAAGAASPVPSPTLTSAVQIAGGTGTQAHTGMGRLKQNTSRPAASQQVAQQPTQQPVASHSGAATALAPTSSLPGRSSVLPAAREAGTSTATTSNAAATADVGLHSKASVKSKGWSVSVDPATNCPTLSLLDSSDSDEEPSNNALPQRDGNKDKKQTSTARADITSYFRQQPVTAAAAASRVRMTQLVLTANAAPNSQVGHASNIYQHKEHGPDQQQRQHEHQQQQQHEQKQQQQQQVLWWQLLDDFVPAQALASGTDPRDGSFVHVLYHKQFTDDAAAAHQARLQAHRPAADRVAQQATDELLDASGWQHNASNKRAGAHTGRKTPSKRGRKSGTAAGNEDEEDVGGAAAAAGHWYTDADGTRVYVDAAGVRSTGRAAYRKYKLSKGKKGGRGKGRKWRKKRSGSKKGVKKTGKGAAGKTGGRAKRKLTVDMLNK